MNSGSDQTYGPRAKYAGGEGTHEGGRHEQGHQIVGGSAASPAIPGDGVGEVAKGICTPRSESRHCSRDEGNEDFALAEVHAAGIHCLSF